MAALLFHGSDKAQGVVPKRIELYDISRPGNNRFTVVCGVHPRYGSPLRTGIKQTVGIQPEVGMSAGREVINNITQQTAITFLAACLASLLGVLLYSPYTPQGNVGLLHLVDVDADRFPLHELTQPFLRRLHYQFKVFLLFDA